MKRSPKNGSHEERSDMTNDTKTKASVLTTMLFGEIFETKPPSDFTGSVTINWFQGGITTIDIKGVQRAGVTV